MNKKGEKIISVYWFAILFIVAAGIVYIVAAFYGQPYDVREMEADILTDKIAECVSSQGVLSEVVFQNDFDEEFLNVCNLNFNVEDYRNWKSQGQYYIELNIINFSSENGTDDARVSVSEGNQGLKDFCFREGKNLPFCLERSFYSLDEEGNQYKVNILSIVRKTEKNAQ